MMNSERSALGQFILLAVGVLGVLFLLVYWASPQTSMGPIKSPQINQNLYVGQSGYATIQSAVSYGCRTGNKLFAVVIPAGAAPTDTIAAVTGGCSTTYISDQRNEKVQNYRWSGSQYVGADVVVGGALNVGGAMSAQSGQINGSPICTVASPCGGGGGGNDSGTQTQVMFYPRNGQAGGPTNVVVDTATKNYMQTPVINGIYNSDLFGGMSALYNSCPTAPCYMQQPYNSTLTTNRFPYSFRETYFRREFFDFPRRPSSPPEVSTTTANPPSGTVIEDLRGGGVIRWQMDPTNPNMLNGNTKVRAFYGNMQITQAVNTSFPDYGYWEIHTNYAHGGINYLLSPPLIKSNYQGFSQVYTFHTPGQHVPDSTEMYCYSHGDCLLGPIDRAQVSAGCGDPSDECSHLSAPTISELATVLTSQCVGGCTTDSTLITSNNISDTDSQSRVGDNQWIEDWNAAHVIYSTTAGCLISAGNSQALPLATVTLAGGACIPDSVVLLGTTAFPSIAGTVSVTIQTSGLPPGFSSSTSGFPASGMACVADDLTAGGDSSAPDYFEQAAFTKTGTTTLSVTLQKPHPHPIILAYGGACGYDLIPDANVNGSVASIAASGTVAQSNHAVYSLSNVVSLGDYAHTVPIRDTSGFNLESSVNSWTINISAISRASNVTTVTLNTTTINSQGLTVTIAGVADASFNGTFTASQTGPNTFTYPNSGSDGSSSGGNASVNYAGYTLVPAAQILSAMNPATKKIDGNLTLYPNNVQWANNDPLVFPNHPHMQISGTSGYGGITRIQPNPNFSTPYADGGNGVILLGHPGPTMNGYTVRFNVTNSNEYVGHGGNRGIPGAAYSIARQKGYYKYAAYWPLGDAGGLYFALNSFAVEHGVADFRAASNVLCTEFAGDLADCLSYNPNTRSYNVNNGGFTVGGKGVCLTDGTNCQPTCLPSGTNCPTRNFFTFQAMIPAQAWAPSTSYYLGIAPALLTVATGSGPAFVVPHACTFDMVYAFIANPGALPSGENVTITLYNGTQAVNVGSATQTWNHTTLGFLINLVSFNTHANDGDNFYFVIATPSWATAPSNLALGAYAYCKT